MKLLVKRLFDISLAITGLVFSSWMWVFISICVIIQDGFPIIIKQKRIGKDGRIFKSFKFRSMIKSASKEKVSRQALENDPRITNFGNCLRKTALDELPQLLNILKGDMSFVGPRPLLPLEIEVNCKCENLHVCNIQGYEERAKMVPGLTGIAQVYAPRDLTRVQKFKYDLEYIKTHNLWLDIKLILFSFLITFRACWEKRGTKLSFLERQ